MLAFKKEKEKKKRKENVKSGVVAGLLNVVLLLGVKENQPDIKLLEVESIK